MKQVCKSCPDRLKFLAGECNLKRCKAYKQGFTVCGVYEKTEKLDDYWTMWCLGKKYGIAKDEMEFIWSEEYYWITDRNVLSDDGTVIRLDDDLRVSPGKVFKYILPLDSVEEFKKFDHFEIYPPVPLNSLDFDTEIVDGVLIVRGNESPLVLIPGAK